MNRFPNLRLFSLAALAAVAASCSRGNDSSVVAGGDFLVLRTEPLNNGRLFLNDPIRIDFTQPVDLDSADLDTVSFQVLDQNGRPLTEQPAGHFELDRSPTDQDVGRRLLFVPRFPTNDTFDNGGFRPGRTYLVRLVGGDPHNDTVLRSAAYSVRATGSVASATTTTISVADSLWVADAFIGKYVRLTSGNQLGQIRLITANTSNQITFGELPLAPGSGDTFSICDQQSRRALGVPITFSFSTADGTTPAQLFRNPLPGGPRRADFVITPAPDNGVVLNKFGSPPLELRLVFDQPLNPNSNNVPVALDTDPLLRSSNDRGRVFLEYDDAPVAAGGFGDSIWIPADVELEVNDLARSVVLLRPVGVLPNNAQVRVIVENTLEDISGESSAANAAYSRIFATFRTRPSYEPQFDAVIEDFVSANNIDFDAPFLSPVAEVQNGFVKAGFAFEGSRTELVFAPNVQEVVLNTDFTQVVPSNGMPFNVSGGVFQFKNVDIQAGVIVKGQGTRPMVWLVNNDFVVGGTLTVSGGDGDRVNTLQSANFPSAGGVGTCGGGRGGRGSPNSLQRSPQAESGFGAGQVPGGGGGPGLIACGACGRGSGGGGGSLSTQGDPDYKALAGSGTLFQQQVGRGGQGCLGVAGAGTRNLNGGAPGPKVFKDARIDNDFWGAGVNVNLQIRITGELPLPVGGEGGGGGGNRSVDNCNATSNNFVNDNKGGGGGGGGGVLIVKALHDIIITSTGKIRSDGGNGGGGEQAGSCNQGGGGGAGSGGMVILMAGHEIQIHAKGSGTHFLYGSENDYDFSVSADGGICTTGTFGSPMISGKYPLSGTAFPPGFNALYDSAPLGALGGMGVVQLMAPPGPPAPGEAPDNTNTVLDDHIKVFRGAGPLPLSGTDKKQVLAWRGFPDANGIFVDDSGTPTGIGHNEGDIRPAPILLPVPYGAKSELQSKWLDTGASSRRRLVAPDTLPRGIVESGQFLAGPTYEFAGIVATSGYVSYQTGGETVRIDYPAVLATPADILSASSGASFLGQPAYLVTLQQPSLGNVVDRYSQYEAELLNANSTVVGSFRILSHTDRTLLLGTEAGLLPQGATRLQVRAKFFKISTNGSEGLGPTYTIGSSNGQPVPNANVRIGFAFHQDPADARALRFPTQPGTFTYDLANAATIESIRLLHARFVRWDVQFDTAFKSLPADNPPSLSPSSPRPELHFLRLPFRF